MHKLYRAQIRGSRSDSAGQTTRKIPVQSQPQGKMRLGQNLRLVFCPGCSKKPPKLLLLSAVLLIGGGTVAYLNFAQRAPRSLLPAGTQLVPQTAIATMTLTTDELTWTKLRQFGTAETQQQFDGLLSAWKDRLFTLNGYSFKRDIKPWIGDRVTLAVLTDKDASGDSASESLGGIDMAAQNLVLVIPIDDPLKAKTLIGEGPKASSITWSDRTYKGVDIKTIESKDGLAIESAVIGSSWLLLSNSQSGIEQAIDTHKGGRSLLDIAGYRKAATRVESPQPPGKKLCADLPQHSSGHSGDRALIGDRF